MKKLKYNINCHDRLGNKSYKASGYQAFKLYGFKFGVHKDNQWIVSELSTGFLVARGNTRAEAIRYSKTGLFNIGQVELIKAVKGAELRLKHNKYIREIAPTFKKIFKSELSYFTLPAGLGLDLIRFDDYIKTPPNISCKAWVAKQYGNEGLTIIKNLLKG